MVQHCGIPVADHLPVRKCSKNLLKFAGTGIFGTNMSLQRNFKITETTRLQFRAEAFNIFNRANFIIPVGVLGAANFGKLLAAEDARQMQFALKLYF